MKVNVTIGELVVVVAPNHDYYKKVGKVVDLPVIGTDIWVIVKFADKKKVLFSRHQLKRVEDNI